MNGGGRTVDDGRWTGHFVFLDLPGNNRVVVFMYGISDNITIIELN